MGGFCSKKRAPLKVVESVDVEKFLGTWYVIGVIPTPFEKGACNPVERYSWDADKKRIAVDFTFNKDKLDGPVKSIPQTLYTSGYPTCTGSMKASPFWPLKLPYLVMELSEDYEHVMIGYPSRSFLWIMSRTTSMDQSVYDSYVEIAKNQEYDVSKIVKPLHNE